MVTTDLQPLSKPKVDDWSYRSITLQNGLQALLISDESADMAAAAMDVRLCAREAFDMLF